MKKKIIAWMCMAVLACTVLSGCSGTEEKKEAELEDGVYTADFNTDSGMFHVNEACEGKGTLTVKDGEMVIHISLSSKNIVNLFCGLAEDAKEDGAELLWPTTDTVTYSDGTTEEVYGFDVPVPALDEEFDLALIGTKGKWYDHKVSVSNPEGQAADGAFIDLDDGEYAIEVELSGGTGRTTVNSPAGLIVKDGSATARIEWSSTHYDYMIVDGEKYLPVNEEGYSTFEIPILVFDEPMDIVADTTAMSTPHEIEYTLTFLSDSVMSKNATPQAAAQRMVYMVFLIMAVCALVSFLSKRKRNRRA
jgi:hypothetical protein